MNSTADFHKIKSVLILQKLSNHFIFIIQENAEIYYLNIPIYRKFGHNSYVFLHVLMQFIIFSKTFVCTEGEHI